MGFRGRRSSCCIREISALVEARGVRRGGSDSEGTGKEVFFCAGEHDVLNDDGAQFRERYAKARRAAGWYSFDKKGVPLHRAGERDESKAGGLGSWVTSSWSGWKRRQAPEAQHTNCGVSRTFRCGAFIRNGAGARTTVRRRWHI